MSSRTRMVVVVLWLSSLLGVGTLASGQWQVGFDAFAEPYVLSGDDIGLSCRGCSWRRPCRTTRDPRHGRRMGRTNRQPTSRSSTA